MSEYDPLHEDDFVTEFGNGQYVDAIFVGEDHETVVAYGHIDPDEMVELTRKLISGIGEDPDDSTLWRFEADDVLWEWAIRVGPDGAFKWVGVGEDLFSFPITVLELW